MSYTGGLAVWVDRRRSFIIHLVIFDFIYYGHVIFFKNGNPLIKSALQRDTWCSVPSKSVRTINNWTFATELLNSWADAQNLLALHTEKTNQSNMKNW